ncbi:MAG TPA: PTS sugar transporter subunit IIA, partial [Planctomycetota bacterium]|nr:PTS sugar transporter subunit IIA [Planctomycetota bacterium]
LLSRALERGGIRRGVEAADARAALRAIVAGLELPPGIDRETVAALFAAQETLVPVGGGVAIPHARAPVVLPLKDPLVALAFLARPVPSTARDGGPIGAAFAVFSPTVRIHLHVLSKIGQALNDDATHALIARRAPDAELLARLREVEAAAPRATLPGPAGPGASAEEAR